MAKSNSIAREPTYFEAALNSLLSTSTLAAGVATVALVFILLGQVIYNASPAIREDGLSILAETSWNPTRDSYGLLPAIVGTVVSSLIALALGSVFGVAVAIFLTQDFLYSWVATLLKNIIDLLAAIPSVVYGLWGMVVILPLLRPMAEWLYQNMSWFPPFSTPLSPTGGMAPAALVLSIMVLPTITAISRDALAAVHPKIKEAAYGLGATRWEVIFRVMLPTASGGIFGSMILAFGRALGETMALAMLMGNVNNLSWSIFAPGNTLAALMANNYKEAGDDIRTRLIYAALVLLIITMVVNVIGTLIINRTSARLEGGK